MEKTLEMEERRGRQVAMKRNGGDGFRKEAEDLQ